MKPQHSPPIQQAKLSVLYLPSTRANCSAMQQNNINTCLPRASLLHQLSGSYLSSLKGRSSGVTRYSSDRLRLVKSRSAKLTTQTVFSVRNGSSLFIPRGQLSALPFQYECFTTSIQEKFLHRDPDPPGDPPWSSTLSNNSQTRIVPFITRLANDPIGKEADRETTIGDTKNVNKHINQHGCLTGRIIPRTKQCKTTNIL